MDPSDERRHAALDIQVRRFAEEERSRVTVERNELMRRLAEDG